MPPARRAGAVPDTVRRAVARTFQSTLGSAALTRERAQELADEVLRGAERGAVRAGRGVRQAGHRQREAAVGVSDRVREAIADLRGMTGDDLSELRFEVDRLRRRVDELERKVRASKSGTRTKSRSGERSARGTTTQGKGKPPQGTRS